MNPGDLVELIQPGGGDKIDVGAMDDGLTWQRPAGTLAVHLGRHPRMPGEPAIVVLIDGKLGWIWEYELCLATGATAAGP